MQCSVGTCAFVRALLWLLLVGNCPTNQFAMSGADLCEAIHRCDTERVASALQKMPDANRTDPDDIMCRTPLHIAAAHGHSEIIRMLMASGARLNAREIHDRQPLHYAVKNGHVDVVRMLLEHGAPVDACDYHACTPLHYAAECDNEELVRLLLSNGANHQIKNCMGSTPFLTVFEGKDGKDKADCVALFIRAAAPVDVMIDGESLLTHVLKLGMFKTASSLLAGGAAANVQHLHAAIVGGSKEVVKELLERGISPRTKNPKNGKSALELARVYENRAILHLVMRYADFWHVCTCPLLRILKHWYNKPVVQMIAPGLQKA